jgi:competence protein ComEC
MDLWKRLILSAGLTLAIPTIALADDVTPKQNVTSRVIIRKEASTASDVMGRLSQGERVELVRDLSGWYEVRLPDGTIGYVSKRWTRKTLNNESATADNKPFKVHVIDVGTGLSVFIEGSDFAMLYDGGSQDDLAKGEDNRVVTYIKAIAPTLTTLNHLVLSHPHKDHLELLPDVFDAFIVKNVWDSGVTYLKSGVATQGYCKFLSKVSNEPNVTYHTAIGSSGVHAVPCKTGLVSVPQGAVMTEAPVRLGQNARMSFLYRDAVKHHDPNENSVVVRLDLGGQRILLAGDAEGGERRSPTSPPDADSIEEKLLECCRTDLAADALIVGHHGSSTSSRTSFLDAVNAKVFVISSGPFTYGRNRIKLPDDEIISELERRGQVLRTDLNDEACMEAESKVGPDRDESPGGCSNVVLTVAPSGELTAGYADGGD